MNKAVVALGSNIEPEAHIQAALEALKQTFCLLESSSFIYTTPVGYKKQPDFLNGAVLIETKVNASKTTTVLKQIEQQLGRQRNGNPNGPRKIDLDLILFNDRIMDDDIFERDFLRNSIQQVLPHFNLTK